MSRGRERSGDRDEKKRGGDLADDRSGERVMEALDTGDAPEVAALAFSGVYTRPEAMHQRLDFAPVLRELIREGIPEFAARGDVVIGSHAASVALAGRPEVLRVLVTESAEVRIGRMAAEQELDEPAATRAVQESDAGRRDYLKRFYGIDREQPTHFDIVLNTDHLGPSEAVELITSAATG